MAGDDEDRLSSLSDDILHQILSLSPTKDAVKTGVLSKRWYRLWRTCINNLYFTNINLEDRSSILDFNWFLSQIYCAHLLSESNLINRFYVDIQYSADPDDIISLSIPRLSQWTKYAAAAGVKFLHLLLNYVHGNLHHLHLSPHLPSGVLHCKNLLVLKLRWFSVKSFPFTDKVDFPQLKTLHLEDINFKTHSLFMLFLAGCPVLEDLKVANVFFLEKTDEDHQLSASLNLSNLIRADLRTCTIRDFALQDLHQDIMLARYILNNARLLQTMTIWTDKEKHEIEIELSSCPRASATCQISVY